MKKISNVLLGSLLALSLLSLAACKTKEVVTNGPVTPPVVPPVIPPVIPPVTPVATDIATWLTTPSKTAMFARQNVALNFTTNATLGTVINIDPSTTYQTIDGFGFCLTSGSATVLNALPEPQKTNLLKELFSTDSTYVGISYIRLTIGASDLSANDYTYDEVLPGQTDVNLTNFSIDPDRVDVIPIMKKILAINPNIKILGSPWTSPTWMKTATTGHSGFTGGSLNTLYYDAYARYFVKYIQAMKAEGITIDAITPQNEPLNPNNNPALVMQPAEQANFIKNNLGPQFKTAGLTTKIIAYDHNADRTDYPITVFKDAGAYPFVDGSAFHLYGGTIGALSAVHTAYPEKNLYFTEYWVGGPSNFGSILTSYTRDLIVGAPRNWCKNVILWNLATNASYGPHTDGGCSTCEGALTINGTDVTRNIAYYVIAHASKFVRPGAVRISSDAVTGLSNVAYKNTDGTYVLIVVNTSTDPQAFNIQINGKAAITSLTAGSAATYVWK